MSKKKHKKNARASEALVRLSQCMIVKDEEKNIENALSWGKEIMYEQIVVDTGSTDKTVEIAGRMGAKIAHFKWIDDFAAAKNFAIEQASGNWIAFLDADEYITKEETKNVIPLLTHIMSDPNICRKYLAINTPWVQLDDEGQPKDVYEQERIFQNLPEVRYIGKIHEKLSLTPKNVVVTQDFKIMHTGYTAGSFIVTGKASRNVELLREQLRENPDDIVLKAYLAESLRAQIAVELHKAEGSEEMISTQEKIAEADELYKEVCDSNADIPPLLKKCTYEYFLMGYINSTETDPKLDALCERAHNEFPEEHKFMCYYAMSLNKNGQYRKAFNILQNCEADLERTIGTDTALTTKVMGLLTAQMVLAAQGLGDTNSVLKYAEIILLMDKLNENTLQPYIATLMRYKASVEEVLDVLARIYDMSSKRDLILIARAAKNCGAISLAKRVIDIVGYLGDD